MPSEPLFFFYCLIFFLKNKEKEISPEKFMACHRSPGAGHISQQRLLVNDEMEIHPEEIRRLLAQ